MIRGLVGLLNGRGSIGSSVGRLTPAHHAHPHPTTDRLHHPYQAYTPITTTTNNNTAATATTPSPSLLPPPHHRRLTTASSFASAEPEDQQAVEQAEAAEPWYQQPLNSLVYGAINTVACVPVLYGYARCALVVGLVIRHWMAGGCMACPKSIEARTDAHDIKHQHHPPPRARSIVFSSDVYQPFLPQLAKLFILSRCVQHACMEFCARSIGTFLQNNNVKKALACKAFFVCLFVCFTEPRRANPPHGQTNTNTQKTAWSTRWCSASSPPSPTPSGRSVDPFILSIISPPESRVDKIRNDQALTLARPRLDPRRLS